MRMMEERFMAWLAWKLPMFLVRHCVKQRDETPGGKPARIVLEYK